MKIHKTVHTKSGRIDKRKNTGGKLFIAAYKKAAKKAATERRKKERQAERQAASARKAREREVARKTRERERERARIQRENEKQRQKDLAALEKRNKKISQFVARYQLDCEKIGLFFNKEIALETAEKCIQASVTPAQQKKYYIDGNESAILERTFQSRLLTMVTSVSKGMNPASHYLSAESGKALIAELIEARVKNDDELRAFPSLKSFLTSVDEEETEAKYWHDESKKVSDQMARVIEIRSMLPDDIDDLVEFVEGSEQLTLEALESSEVYKGGLDKKTRLVAELEEKYSSLISD